MFGRFIRTGDKAIKNAGTATASGLKALIRDPQIAIYAYMAVGFIWITSPLVTGFVLHGWRHVDRWQILNKVDQSAPHTLLAHLGLVAFPVFYTFFITAYFTCAVSASTWAKLDGQPTTLLFGLRAVGRRFFRVTFFSILSVFFFPLAVIAQWRKLPRGIVGVVGSSFSMSTSQLAPAIMNKSEGLFGTVAHSVKTLGGAWHESLVIRVTTILSVLVLGLLSFLPKLVQHYWFDGHTARLVGWFLAALLGAGSFVLAKVISTVLTTTLYYKVTHKQL